MKSIRISLIVYFLLLLGVAWSAASWLVYRSAAASLEAKQQSTSDLWHAHFVSQTQQLSNQFDDELRQQAFTMTRVMAAQNQWTRPSFLRVTPLALIGQPLAHFAAPLWVAEATRGPNSPLNSSMTMRLLREVTYSELDLPHTADAGDLECYQINAEWSPPWHSKSLEGETLPYDPVQFAAKELYASEFDHVTVRPDRQMRRVQLKVPASRFAFRPVRGGGPGNRSNEAPPSLQPRERLDAGMPWVVIHCAAETKRRDAALSKLKAEMNQKLDEEAAAAQVELAQLRRRLLLIGLAAFTAMALGGYVLLGIGLAPLRRLSDAVSRVSPRDFKLPLENDASLGVELAPVAEHLRKTLGQLRGVFEREKQASADISHELRTPVASLLTTLDVALRKPRTAEEYRQTLLDCRVVGGQMRQLVERLMALARLDAGSDRVRPCSIDLADLVEECATLVKPLAGERGLSLRVTCPSELTVNTDPDKLREILVNLLHNAIQYNNPNGSIDITAAASGDWLDLRVRDTGVGIAPDVSARIFERFYRGDPSRNADDLHAGLGLSIVKGYVGLLGGTITVESQTGQGSTFHLRLPGALAA